MLQESMVEHHIKYKEIHGVDETIMMTHSEHKKLHIRLRDEGKCNIPVEELAIISMAAHGRTAKVKEYQRKYKNKYQPEYKKKYRVSEQGRNVIWNYKKNIQQINFIESPGMYVQFRETITHNHATDNVTYTAGFCGTGGYKIPMVEIN